MFLDDNSPKTKSAILVVLGDLFLGNADVHNMLLKVHDIVLATIAINIRDKILS